MKNETCHVDHKVLKSFMIDCFRASGVPAPDAEVCADVLIAADLRGIDSHGIGRLKPFYIDRIRAGVQQPVTQVEFVRKGPATAVIDGHAGMAMVIAKTAMQHAVDCAKKYGVGAVAVRNSTHFGIAGYYTLLAASQGCIGMACTNARPAIAPTFSVQNKLGTNPIAVAMPSDEANPFSLDCATSVAQRGKIEYYGRAGKEIPPGWVIDVEGRTRTDTLAILEDLTKSRAALTPIGGIGEEGAGYKGYGLATVVELFSSALQQGYFLSALTGFAPDGSRTPPRIGHFFLALDVESFTDLAAFRKTVGDVLRELRAARLAPGHDRIYTAGEKEFLKIEERKRTGIPISPTLQKTLVGLRDDFKLSQYRFPFED